MNIFYVLCGVVITIVVILLTSKKENEHRHANNAVDARALKRENINGMPVVAPVINPSINTGISNFYGSTATAYPSPENINTQYSNPYVHLSVHPVLNYQRHLSNGIHPANIGDPIRVANISGPSGLYGADNGGSANFEESLLFSKGSVPINAGPKMRDETLLAGPGNGPYPGSYQNLPVPANSLKNGNLNDHFGGMEGYRRTNLGVAAVMNNYVDPSGRQAMINQPLKVNNSSEYVPYGPKGFVGSVDVNAPRGPEVGSFDLIGSKWQKTGILTSSNPSKKAILNLFKRPIAPMQDLWEYQIQDKNGFMIKLNEKYLENGDVVQHVTGKNGMGPWIVHDYEQNKYIWV